MEGRADAVILAAVVPTLTGLSSFRKTRFGEMREMGVRGLLVYCSDFRCSFSPFYELKTRELQFGHGIPGLIQLGSM